MSVEREPAPASQGFQGESARLASDRRDARDAPALIVIVLRVRESPSSMTINPVTWTNIHKL
jgi:hypothetical protein